MRALKGQSAKVSLGNAHILTENVIDLCIEKKRLYTYVQKGHSEFN